MTCLGSIKALILLFGINIYYLSIYESQGALHLVIIEIYLNNGTRDA
jgi:hypothetical protein